MSKCPHCGKVPYPAKNEDGTINWKNVLRIDWFAVAIVISILLLLLGVNQINKQCFDLLEDPCNTLKNVDCTEQWYSTREVKYDGEAAAIPTGIGSEDSGES